MVAIANILAQVDSAHPVTAVDIQCLGGNVIGVLGCEEHGSTYEIFRCAHSAEWNCGTYLAFLLAWSKVFVARK
ncbi:hypothetical protein D9M71_747680 [compost metagenome]